MRTRETKIRYKILRPGAKAPTKTYDGDAGWDLYASLTGDAPAPVVVIQPGQVKAITTGLALEIPKGWMGLIKERSGLASRYGVHVVGGVIDSGYRGELIVLLAKPHLPEEPLVVRDGDRIAQLLLLPVPEVEWLQADDLSPSERGTQGFGSSGRQ